MFGKTAALNTYVIKLAGVVGSITGFSSLSDETINGGPVSI